MPWNHDATQVVGGCASCGFTSMVYKRYWCSMPVHAKRWMVPLMPRHRWPSRLTTWTLLLPQLWCSPQPCTWICVEPGLASRRIPRYVRALGWGIIHVALDSGVFLARVNPRAACGGMRVLLVPRLNGCRHIWDNATMQHLFL